MPTRLVLCLLLLVPLACKRPQPVKATPRPVAAARGTAAATPTGNTVSGKVLERLDVGEYSYLRLDAHSGEQWAAVTKCTVGKGENVVVGQATAMDGFESKTLHRTFDHIVFGVLQDSGSKANVAAPPLPQPTSANPHAGLPGHQVAVPHAGLPGHAPAAAVDEPIAVKPATGPGAMTVAEIFHKGKALDGKPVVIRAKVVKVLPGIMGKTWLHLRDGSGSAEKHDNDLVVTTDEVATLNSEVMVRGTAHSDRDFGSGYRFPVMVENAKISR